MYSYSFTSIYSVRLSWLFFSIVNVMRLYAYLVALAML